VEMILTRENRRTWRNTCTSALLSTTNLTRTDPATNLDFRSERPATNRLSYCTAWSGLNHKSHSQVYLQKGRIWLLHCAYAYTSSVKSIGSLWSWNMWIKWCTAFPIAHVVLCKKRNYHHWWSDGHRPCYWNQGSQVRTKPRTMDF
jgi:hypothetical protein